MLQELMNPPTAKKREIIHFEKKLRVGDKVLQLVNNAEEGVYNGDIGKVESIYYGKETESKTDELVISFEDDKELVYKKTELDQITLAYCCSIHKSQGSEYPLVILPLVDTFSRMLRKDLLYTAVTRAQKSLVMIGNPASFNLVVTQNQTERQTFLSDILATTLTPTSIKAKSEVIETGKDEDNNKIVKVTTTEIPQEEATLKKTVETPTTPVTMTVLELEAKPLEREPVLTAQKLWEVDPMIGMDGISPYDFM